jgi:predicted O-methyltransferase YrrM
VLDNGGGVVHHVVWDQALSDRARRHLAVLGLDHAVEFHVAEAVETLGHTPGPFDLIFNDIQKADYPASLPVIVEKLRGGGVMVVDNMLWHGKVVDPADQTADTRGVHELTRLVRDDPRWISSIVPIRDGVLVAQRL